MHKVGFVVPWQTFASQHQVVILCQLIDLLLVSTVYEYIVIR